MKRKNWFVYLLAALIALQSFGAIADSYRSTSAQISFEDECDILQLSHARTGNTDPNPSSTSYDCYDYCHSFGTAQGESSNNPGLLYASFQPIIPSHTAEFRSAFLPSLYRPPIL